MPIRSAVMNGTSAAAIKLVEPMQTLDIAPYRVIRDYVRFEAGVRNRLMDVAQRMRGALEEPTGLYENYLVSGAPGTGKTQFVKEIAIASNVKMVEINC